MPPVPAPDALAEHRRNTELLQAELPDRRFVDHRYLAWLYDENPHGAAFTESADDGGRRVAHYGLVPQEYRDASGPAPFVFSLNAVTRSGIQRKGYFTTLGRAVYASAQEAGVRVVVGVSNENSTPPVVQKLGWRLYCPLPVKVLVPLRRRAGWTSRSIDDELLASGWFAEVAAGLDDHAAEGWTNRYTLEHLRWRLASPNNPGFALHVGPDLVAISTRAKAGPLPLSVVLKLLPRGGDHPGPTDGAAAVAAACRHHRTPAAIYAGWNRWVHLRGLAPPRRLLPSPLNLIVKSLDPAIDQDELVLDTFEFLDMDAY